MKFGVVFRAAAGSVALLGAIPASATFVDFSYTGASETWVVPVGVTSVFLEAFGAQGFSPQFYSGGLGGYTSGNLAVTPGQALEIYVGGQGTVANVANTPMGGGFNGGGDGVVWANGAGQAYSGGGGGATDVRLNASLGSRVIVAGGGGGASSNGGASGGAGGGLVGATGGGATPGTGGTQSAGGTVGGGFGFGGDGLAGQTGWVGGGGGGWYGGGASPAHYGGGGGSSYIGGVTGGVLTQGVQQGNGALRITFLTSAVPEPGTWATMIMGFGLVGASMRRRGKRKALATV